MFGTEEKEETEGWKQLCNEEFYEASGKASSEIQKHKIELISFLKSRISLQ
jgi:hypothetical protein